MANLIAQNVTWSYELLGAQDGTPAATATPVAAQCLARSIKREMNYSMVDLKGLCATTSANQVTSQTGTIEIELFVAAAGPIFQASNGVYLWSSFVPKAGVTAIVDTGVITKVGLSVDVDGALIETITIALGVN